MGGGDFGSNGSVWWSVRHTLADTGETEARVSTGKDPIRYEDIGPAIGKGAGAFQIKLRFADDVTAWRALAEAFEDVDDGVVTLYVKKTEPQRASPDANAPWEIRIEW